MISPFITRTIFIALLAYSPASFSEALIEAGIHLGGDELIIENYTNGGKDSSKAGNLFSFAMGGTKSFTDKIEGQLSLGIRSDIISSENPEVTWIRYPLNAMLFYRQKSYRIGLGITDHFSPTLKGNGVADNIAESYKDAIGGLLEVDFTIDNHFHWGIRYTSIKYESKRRNRSINGSSIGLLIIALL